MSTKGTQIDDDKKLINFLSYEDYLESLITKTDYLYLKNTEICRRIAELGYRSTGDTLNKIDFEKRKNLAKNLLYPVWHKFKLYSDVKKNFDSQLQTLLAMREYNNRLGIISTIIFIRKHTKLMFNISGYIDYTDRLENENLNDFFKYEKILSPKSSDLIYYHWKNKIIKMNKNNNYDVIIDTDKGLALKNLHDQQFIYLNTDYDPGIDTTKLIIKIDNAPYQQVVIYDHVVKRRS